MMVMNAASSKNTEKKSVRKIIKVSKPAKRLNLVGVGIKINAGNAHETILENELRRCKTQKKTYKTIKA